MTYASETLDHIALPSMLKRAGRKSVLPKMPLAYVRDVTEEETSKLANAECPELPRDQVFGGNIGVGRCKAKYHMLAMMLASGAGVAQAAFVTGYTEQTVRVISQSPMFKDLLSYYGEQKEQEFKDFYKRAAMVGLDAMEILHERMQSNPDEISTKDLRGLMETLLDRTILPSKAAAQAPTQAPPPAINFIQFVDSPHAQAPAAPSNIIEGELSKPRRQS